MTRDIKVVTGNLGQSLLIRFLYICTGSYFPETKRILNNQRKDPGELFLEDLLTPRAFCAFFLWPYCIRCLNNVLHKHALWSLMIHFIIHLSNAATRYMRIVQLLLNSIGSHLCNLDNMLIPQFIKQTISSKIALLNLPYLIYLPFTKYFIYFC